jgi:predicted transcriptional regulator
LKAEDIVEINVGREMDFMSAKEMVLEALKSSPEPLKTQDIVQKTGLDKKEVEKVIKELKSEGLIESPKRCFYKAK